MMDDAPTPFDDQSEDDALAATKPMPIVGDESEESPQTPIKPIPIQPLLSDYQPGSDTSEPPTTSEGTDLPILEQTPQEREEKRKRRRKAIWILACALLAIAVVMFFSMLWISYQNTPTGPDSATPFPSIAKKSKKHPDVVSASPSASADAAPTINLSCTQFGGKTTEQVLSTMQAIGLNPTVSQQTAPSPSAADHVISYSPCGSLQPGAVVVISSYGAYIPPSPTPTPSTAPQPGAPVPVTPTPSPSPSSPSPSATSGPSPKAQG